MSNTDQEKRIVLLIDAKVPVYEEQPGFLSERKFVGFKNEVFSFNSDGSLTDSTGKSLGRIHERESSAKFIMYMIQTSLRGKIVSVMDSEGKVVKF